MDGLIIKETDNEKQNKIKIAKRLYQRNWRKNNKAKYLKNMENFWLRQYEELIEDSENEAKVEAKESLEIQ